MEPIATAIIAAITAGVTTGAMQAGQQAISDAYAGLKQLIAKKLGEPSEVTAAIDGLEKRSKSQSRQDTLSEELQLAKADEDQELVRAAEDLLRLLKAPGDKSPGHTIQMAIGKAIGVANNNSTATVEINSTKPQKRKK